MLGSLKAVFRVKMLSLTFLVFVVLFPFFHENTIVIHQIFSHVLESDRLLYDSIAIVKETLCCVGSFLHKLSSLVAIVYICKWQIQSETGVFYSNKLLFFQSYCNYVWKSLSLTFECYFVNCLLWFISNVLGFHITNYYFRLSLFYVLSSRCLTKCIAISFAPFLWFFDVIRLFSDFHLKIRGNVKIN